jgi:type I restriction enzyme M protein
LGIKDVEPDIFGRAYEYLLRKFAEGQGQSAGEFYTPREVAILMSYILDPEPGQSVYDPTCGSGGLLIKANLRFEDKYGDGQATAPLSFYGQEINPATYAIARMNTFIYDMDAHVRLGNTMINPAFTNPDGRLMTFDLVTANPMWNQKFPQSTYENESFERFGIGSPPSSSADWGWILHMYSSLNDGGKIAVVLDTGAASRGSGNKGSNRERDIRRVFVEKDLVECVILLPENLFYNTPSPGIIMVIRKGARDNSGKILLINASSSFNKGRPKNYLAEDNIEKIAGVYKRWETEEGFSCIITSQEATTNDFNLGPARYISTNEHEEVLPLEEAVVLLQEAEEERSEADAKLEWVLKELGMTS